jgi:hypothetical protein
MRCETWELEAGSGRSPVGQHVYRILAESQRASSFGTKTRSTLFMPHGSGCSAGGHPGARVRRSVQIAWDVGMGGTSLSRPSDVRLPPSARSAWCSGMTLSRVRRSNLGHVGPQKGLEIRMPFLRGATAAPRSASGPVSTPNPVEIQGGHDTTPIGSGATGAPTGRLTRAPMPASDSNGVS